MVAKSTHQRLGDILQVVLNRLRAEVVDHKTLGAICRALYLLSCTARDEEQRNLRPAQSRRQDKPLVADPLNSLRMIRIEMLGCSHCDERRQQLLAVLG